MWIIRIQKQGIGTVVQTFKKFLIDPSQPVWILLSYLTRKNNKSHGEYIFIFDVNMLKFNEQMFYHHV
jgi:hypothetical protein